MPNRVQRKGKLLPKQATRASKDRRARNGGWIMEARPELEKEWRWWRRTWTWDEIRWARFACFYYFPRLLSKRNQPMPKASEVASQPPLPALLLFGTGSAQCFLFPLLYFFFPAFNGYISPLYLFTVFSSFQRLCHTRSESYSSFKAPTSPLVSG